MKKLLMFLFLMTISLGQSQNLITNGDFSTGIDGWVGADGYVSSGVYSRTAPGGQQPYEVNLGYPLSITTPVGTGYTLSFQASSTTGRTIIAGLGLNGGDYTNVIQTVTLTSTPKRFTLNFNTNFSSASSRIFFDMGNVAGDVTIDNVVLSLTPSNLITNGDFESGDTGWTGATGNLVTTGDDATYYSRTAPGGQQPYEVNLSRPVSIATPVGTSYQLSFQAWSNTGKTMLAGIGLNGGDYTNVTQSVTLTSTPQTFFLDFTTNFSSASSRIIFDMGTDAGDVNIDNVVLSSAAVTSTCYNGVQDGDETGIDCGGSCSACPEVVNIEGKWKVTELGVGPAKGSYGYFSLNVSSGERSCFFDDVYQFNADASFNFLPGTQTYREGWLGSGCGAPVAPFDGSNAATYTNSGSAITVTGTGAFIGLPKAINGAEIDNTAAHPGIVTYQATSVTTTAMTLDIAVAGGAWWRYKLAKVDESLPIISDFPALEKALTDLPFDLATPTSNSAGAFTYTSSNQAVATISGATVTIVGAGTTTITATQAANGTYNTGSITAQLVVAYPAPAVAATTPTRAAEDVISVFSNAYTDIIGTAFRSFGGATTWTQLNIATNPTNRYTNFDYVGNTFGAGGVNATDMQQLHLDIWTPDCTSFDVYVLDGSDEQKVTLTPTTSEWNSFDIDLAQYPLLTKSGIVELKFVNGGSGTKTIYLDNIYFWKTPAGTLNYYVDADADGYGAGTVTVSATPIEGSVTNNTDCNDSVAAINPGATEILDGIDNDCDGSIDEGFPPATDAPEAPARNPWDVKSVYSSAYTNFAGVDFFPNWDQSTTFTNFTPVSDETLKYSNLTYQGIDFNGGKNVSAMTTLHLDVFSRDISSINVALIAGGENSVIIPLTAGWNSINLDLATQYAGRNLTNAIQLKLERTLWTPTDGSVNSLYVDNIYFYRAATGSTYYVDADGDGYGAGTAVTLEPSTAPSGYSVNNTDCDDTKALVNPGATEIFDTIDNDCDGSTDEGTTLGAPVVANPGICKGTVGATPSATALPGYTLVWYKDGTTTTALTAAPVITATKTFFVAQRLGTTGPISSRASVTTTVNDLPTVPSKIELTSGLEVIKKVGNFIDTSTELTLTATPATGTVATATYIWTLPTTPTGVSQKAGEATNGAVITVNFNDVTAANTAIDFLVSSVSAAGCVSKTAKKLTVTRSEAGKPKGLILTDALLPEVLKITKLDAYTGALKSTRVLTLTATPNTKAGSQATSYKWVLPETVAVTSSTLSSELELDGIGTRTVTTSGNVLEFTLANVTNEASFLFKVFGVNGNGESLLSKDLTCTSAAPKAPAAIYAGTDTSSTGVKYTTYNNSCETVTMSVPAVLGVTYSFESVIGGAVIGTVTGNSVSVNLSGTSNVAKSTIVIRVIATTSTGFASKEFTIRTGLTCSAPATTAPRIAPEAATTEKFSAMAYPNPSTEGFRVKSSNGKSFGVQVYDMLGRSIEQRQMSSDAQIGSNYAKGIYNVIVNQGANVKTLRVIKQ